MPYTPEPDPPPILPPNWRFRFSLKKVMLLTTILCILFAIWQGLLRAGVTDNMSGIEPKFWVIAVVTLPLLIMVFAGLIEPARKLYARLRRRD
jgi:hypothetical protein